jgi:hypothetical protein
MRHHFERVKDFYTVLSSDEEDIKASETFAELTRKLSLEPLK